MPQQTNLNISPYFDDYDSSDGYYKVLFKPGYPVQARELTSLQSILQNQIEKFGRHFFKEGSKVIPGNTGYTQLYYCVRLNNTYQGIPVSAYVDQLVGAKITGQNSGVSAVVNSVVIPNNSEIGITTLYISYINSNIQNNTSIQFFDNEELTCDTTLNSTLLGNSTISPNTTFATTLATNSAAIGSSFQIYQGVYFIRGHFVDVASETLILDQYSNRPSYRIGLGITEEIITPEMDSTLNDNSQGYSNYAAPGADRFKISARLFKKPLDDFDDDNFIELATIEDGVLRDNVKNSSASSGQVFSDNLADTLAQRTFDESGNYVTKSFDVSLLNSLNNNLGNGGIFQDGEFTYGGSIASEDLALLKISSGKAYVNGYEVETTNSTFIDVDKPRTTNTVLGESIQYNTGSTFKLNRVTRCPKVGVGNTYVVSLRDSLVGADQNVAAGNEIGLARIYDLSLNSGNYNASTNSALNEWGISLYDIQPFTTLTLNQSHTLTVPTLVKGAFSGATGFLRSNVTAGTAVTVYNRNGSFVNDEPLIFNGIHGGRIVVDVDEKSISDVKSLYANDNGVDASVGINTFSANVIQSKYFNIGIATVGSDGKVTSTNPKFLSTVKSGDLITYSDLSASKSLITVKVSSISSEDITVQTVQNVAGITSSYLPSSGYISVSDMNIVKSQSEKSQDNTLYTKLPKRNIATIDLDDSLITIRKVFNVNITAAGSIDPSTTMEAGSSELFLPFTPQRYSLIRSDGITEELTEEKFIFNAQSNIIENIVDLGTEDTGAQLIATLRKTSLKPKTKLKDRVRSVLVNKSKISGSGIGSTTLNNGLEYGNYPFGTRVEDEFISLNNPDIIEIHGVFESDSTDSASAPKMQFSNINSVSSTSQEIAIGEVLIGETSGAIAICVGKPDTSSILFISKNGIDFLNTEEVVFQESLVRGTISSVVENGFNISSNYTFSNGQNETFYGQGFLRKKADKNSPTKSLMVYYASASFDSGDTGDFTAVGSYNNFDYAKEIQSINRISNADMIDIRPRVSSYTVTENSRSPLEFLGRSFDRQGNSAKNILASNESITLDYSYYLGRIDRLFLTKDGKFQIVFGTPSDNPEKPDSIDNAIEIATIKLPPYLYNSEAASIKTLEYKRYTMSDIKNLENRIRNLEYYTTLSLLESKTESSFISDSDGFNRFKSGFFVDNFTSFKTQETNYTINNSIDRKNKELRPKHYTSSVNMIPGPVENLDPETDYRFNVIDGENVERLNDILTLSFSEVEWLSQSFATRSETVTPFTANFWQGTSELTPATDTWVDTVRVKAKVIETEGNYAATVDYYERTNALDAQTGFIPILWDSWESNWIGVTNNEERSKTDALSESTTSSDSSGTGEWKTANPRMVSQEELQETIDIKIEGKGGSRTLVYDDTQNISSTNDRSISRDLVSFMRPRNIEFYSKRMKPGTRVYPFFDGIDISRYCVPKLVEIKMESGAFQVGENIRSVSFKKGISSVEFYGRVAQINHKEGPYNVPTKIYNENPYNGLAIPSQYDSASQFINIDTYALSNEYQTNYYGYLEVGTYLIGETSGATATVSDLRLVVDSGSTVMGSFYIPETISSYHPRFESGVKEFVLTSSLANNAENATTISSELYSSVGLPENSSSIRSIRLEDKKEFEERLVKKAPGTQIVGAHVLGYSSPETINAWYDPLAQTFTVDDESGIFITKCDIFFSEKDNLNIPITLQIRPVEGDLPSSKVIPLSEVVLDPEDVSISGDASVPTSFEFKSPIYLEGRKQYAICILSNSNKYKVFTSRIGESDFSTDSLVSTQPFLGSLFKSQNTSKWEASQLEDLKFNIYRADFEPSGSIDLYNQDLSAGNRQIANLLPNSIEFKSRRLKIGLSSEMDGSNNFVIGNTFSQTNTNATGNLVGVAATVTSVTVTNAGVGYTPASGNATYNNINLSTITGNGRGAIGVVTVTNGNVAGVHIVNGGSGYNVGDVLGISSIGSGVGRDSKFTITNIGPVSEIILDNVSGEFVVGVANTIFFTSSNTSIGSTELNYSSGGGVQISTINQDTADSDGLHIKVNHQNHGMYFEDNKVEISGVESDLPPAKLTAEYLVSSSGQISIDDNSIFQNFEGISVGANNIGYLKIGEEIIEYTQTTGSTLIGGSIVRGSNRVKYPIGTLVYKYENSGVNLARINKTHDMNDVTLSDSINLDSYYLKLDTSEKFNTNNFDRSLDTDAPKLYVNESKSSGGYNIRSSQNMPYEVISPMVHYKTAQGSTVAAEIRTTTTVGINGVEVPYLNYGFERVSLNRPNYLDTPRAVFSKVNETERLNNITGNKSLVLRLFLNTVDSRVSPIIDTQRINAILTTNRINDPIENYATDPRVNTLDIDPSAFQYVSREVSLENPATSVKILLNGYLTSDSDIRAFYCVGDSPTSNPIFVPFPGYDNIDQNNNIISVDKSNGKPDIEVQKTNVLDQTSSDLEFKEYSFTIDQLQAFKYYRIKLIMTSTNQVYVPRIKDLRVIALA
ncbi:MAG: hypothetical protein CBD74_00190 [Saprospirales bacterium TMED214]|nr:MAG: hypothetical protein CBD74_00190 [Saprospirales bacterium TMED214]